MSAKLLDRIKQGAARGGQWSAVALGFSLPLSVALDNLLLVALLACWVASGQVRTIVRIVTGSRVVACVALLAALHAVGLLHTLADRQAALAGLWNGARLLLLLALIPPFLDERTRARALGAFAAAMILTLGVSLLVAAGLLAPAGWHKGTLANPVAFKYHITHNLFMALAALLFALRARAAPTPAGRWLFATAAVLAVLNVLFMVPGRTGHVVMLVLIVYFFASWMRWRGLVVGMAVVAAMMTAAFLTPQSAIHARFATAVDEYQTHVPGEATTKSIGSRIEFYTNAAAIFAEHPALGVGTGGFPAAYTARVAGTAQGLTDNPHNEYLLMATQFGVPGLLVFCAVFVLLWLEAARIPAPLERHLARGTAVLFAVASLASSTLMDHAEGLLFVWLIALLYAQTVRGPTAARP